MTTDAINYDEVICPNCVHQFRAIPVNVQHELAAANKARRVAEFEAARILVLHKAVMKNAAEELQNIMSAKLYDTDHFPDGMTFALWARSRARHTLTLLGALHIEEKKDE